MNDRPPIRSQSNMMAPGILRLAAIFSAIVTVDDFTALGLLQSRDAAKARPLRCARLQHQRERGGSSQDGQICIGMKPLSCEHEPPWWTRFGCILFVARSLAKYTTILTTPSPGTTRCRSDHCVLVFVVVQNPIDLPLSR